MIILDLNYLETISENSVAGGNNNVVNTLQVTSVDGQVVSEKISGSPYTKQVLPDGTILYIVGNPVNPLTLTLAPS